MNEEKQTNPTLPDLLSVHHYFDNLGQKSEAAKAIINLIEEKVLDKIKALIITTETNNL